IRNRLADTVRFIVCQRLLPKNGGGRVAALEIMGMNLRVKDVILNGESDGKTYNDIIANGTAFGMQTFDQHILNLFRDGYVTEETAFAYCSQKNALSRGVDVLKRKRGEKTTDIDGLAIDWGKNEEEEGGGEEAKTDEAQK
ncbi:MAG: twitching motility protein, partial [Desulfamplus sp.]|nr:twitching motility protein [Desulfamplus sp.]